jgi:hypothetical protein
LALAKSCDVRDLIKKRAGSNMTASSRAAKSVPRTGRSSQLLHEPAWPPPRWKVSGLRLTTTFVVRLLGQFTNELTILDRTAAGLHFLAVVAADHLGRKHWRSKGSQSDQTEKAFLHAAKFTPSRWKLNQSHSL